MISCKPIWTPSLSSASTGIFHAYPLNAHSHYP